MIINLISYIISILILNFIIFKTGFLKSHSGFVHQKFLNHSVPLSGGLFILLPTFLFFYSSYPLMFFSFFLIFVLGLLSDLNILATAKYRFLIQFIVISLFVFWTQLEVLPSRIEYIDNNFQNTFYSFFFTIFCLMVLINGSNFIDGLNGLFLGYNIIILLILIKLDLLQTIGLSNENFIFLIIILFFLLILNFSNRLFMGDGGAYSLSFLLGFILIMIYKNNPTLSPYFIIVLLWYPCFENLFSIIRKFLINKNPMKPDNNHLHHYLYLAIQKRFGLNNLLSNNLSSIIINLFNLSIFYLASLNINYTQNQFLILFVSILFYLVIYFFLKKKVS
tara:strand:+ start:173 stop:1177 length:1005 start_codon:yes stop_codon:yes gene_type:complete